MITRIKTLAVYCVIFFLTACGYHLAGKADLDPVFDKTYVGYQGQGLWVAELIEQQLKANKITPVAQKEADANIIVLYERQDRDILSVDESGKVREYELILEIGIGVMDKEGKRLAPDQNIRLSRDFLFDINDTLGKGEEEQKLYQEMREDAARLVIYRLQAITVPTDSEENSSEAE